MKIMKCVICVSMMLLVSTSFAKSGTGFLKMSEIYFVVDRVEANLVVCENNEGDMIDIHEDEFTKLPKSGDVIKQSSNGIYKVDRVRTAIRKIQIKKRFDKLTNIVLH